MQRLKDLPKNNVHFDGCSSPVPPLTSASTLASLPMIGLDNDDFDLSSMVTPAQRSHSSAPPRTEVTPVVEKTIEESAPAAVESDEGALSDSSSSSSSSDSSDSDSDAENIPVPMTTNGKWISSTVFLKLGSSSNKLFN